MPSVLCFHLDIEDGSGFSPNMAPLFHGFLHERLSPGFAAKMHETGLHPFAQNVSREDGGYFWNVSALNAEAEKEITAALDGLTEITLTNKQIVIHAERAGEVRQSYDELFSQNYLGYPKSRYVKLAFDSPTAFKSAGRYVNMPTAKYDAFSDTTEVGSEELFDQLARDTEIAAYNLRSCAFSLEGVKIPAFRGTVTIRAGGSQTFVSFVNMLADYAGFSGCGIKTALGMGSVKHLRNEAKHIE